MNGGPGPLEVRGSAGAIEGTTYAKNAKVHFTRGGNDLVQAAGGSGRP